jgi:predicted ATPase with chaperone activity
MIIFPIVFKETLCRNASKIPFLIEHRYALVGIIMIPNRSDIVSDTDMCIGEIPQFCMQPEGQRLMWMAMMQLNLSAHTCHRILKLARRISDLAGCEANQFDKGRRFRGHLKPPLKGV